jgi:heme exporter protein CcmD
MAALGPHAGFILAAYLATAAILIGLTLAILLDRRAQRRALAALEERGAGRRGGSAP